MWKQIILGLAASLGAGYLFYRVVPIDQMSQALGQMELWYLAPCAAVYMISYLFRAKRWQYLLKPVGQVGYRDCFGGLLIGFLGNNLLPAHLGEFVRAVVVGKKAGLSVSGSMATIVLERVYDGLTVLLFLLAVLLFMDLPGAGPDSLITLDTLRNAGWAGLALFGGLLLVLQAFRWQKERSLKLAAFCLKPLPEGISQKILSLLDAFAQGLSTSKASDLVWVGVYSLLTWGCLALWAWLLFPAFGLHLGLMAGVLTEVVISLALLIPSAPAFLGVFHLAAAATLSFLGADGAVAGSYALVLWLVHFVTTTLTGIYYLWSMGFSWKILAGKN